jgi:uncharacterized protein with PQ loop repeat
LATIGCEHSGNVDLYGLGIRLGICLSILSTILGMILMPDVLYDFQDSDAILLAIYIALIMAYFIWSIVGVELTIVWDSVRESYQQSVPRLNILRQE